MLQKIYLRADFLLDLQVKIKWHQFTKKELILMLLMMIHRIKELKIPFLDVAVTMWLLYIFIILYTWA